MATYKKIGPHNWQFRLRHTDKRTKEKSEFKRSRFYSKPQAEDAVIELKNQLDNGYDVSSDQTLVNYINYWIETYKSFKLKQVAKNTCKQHRNNLVNHIKPYFQQLKLLDLTHDLYQEFINQLVSSEEYSKRTIEIIHGTVYGAMWRAKVSKRITDNPCEEVIIRSAREKDENKIKNTNRQSLSHMIRLLIFWMLPSWTI